MASRAELEPERARPRPLPVPLPEDGAACQACPGNAGAPCPVAAKKRAWPPRHRLLTKAGSSGALRPAVCPRPQWPRCLLWRPSPGRALAVPCGYLLTRKLTGVRVSPGRPPGLRGPPRLCSYRAQGSGTGTHTWGFWLPPLPGPRRSAARFLVSARLAAATTHPLSLVCLRDPRRMLSLKRLLYSSGDPCGASGDRGPRGPP